MAKNPPADTDPAPAADPAGDDVAPPVIGVLADDDLVDTFVDEVRYESNGTLDEPESTAPIPTSAAPFEAGQFAGFGVEHIARNGEEWIVDPETGLLVEQISAPAPPDAVEAETDPS